MIQRVQTLLLAGVVILMIAGIFVPSWEKHQADTGELATLDALALTHLQPAEGGEDFITNVAAQTWYIALLCALAAGIAAFEIFQFNNRLLQMKLGAFNSLVIAGVVVAVMLLSRQGEALFDPMVVGKYQAGFYLPMAAIFMNIVANRFIQRDERLVRSMDRLR
ncbi:MAG: DUF4293 domain-containing protein [Catalinimonas sp.]